MIQLKHVIKKIFYTSVRISIKLQANFIAKKSIFWKIILHFKVNYEQFLSKFIIAILLARVSFKFHTNFVKVSNKLHNLFINKLVSITCIKNFHSEIWQFFLQFKYVVGEAFLRILLRISLKPTTNCKFIF